MAERRSYSGNATPTTITANITAADTNIGIAAVTGWPDGSGGPFFVQLESEVIKCVGRTGSVLNVQTTPLSGRGWGGTTAASHVAGAAITHVFTATDADDANKHYADGTTDDHSQYLNIARHDLSTRHPASVLPLGGTPTNSAPGDTAASGSATTISRSDHKHGRESAAGGAVRAGVSLSATSTSVAASTTPNIVWTSAPVNTNGYITVPSSNIVIPTGFDGIYAFTAQGNWSGYFSESRTLFITVGGSLYPIALPVAVSGLGGGYSTSWSGSITVPIAAGTTITVAIGHGNASTQTTSAYLQMYRVSA